MSRLSFALVVLHALGLLYVDGQGSTGHCERPGVARYPELAQFVEQHSLRRGQFILASGRPSRYYIDGKLTAMNPHGAVLIAKAILAEIEGLPVDAIGGMDMGATPIVGAIAAVSDMTGRPVPVFVVRKEVKKHGTMKPIEGLIPESPSKVVIVDDVVTTGDSILKAIDEVQKSGHEVVLAISVLDRNAGATEALARRHIPYQPLVTLEDIGVSDEPNRRGSEIGIG
jgi:orotate phosphoribosyltransferase